MCWTKRLREAGSGARDVVALRRPLGFEELSLILQSTSCPGAALHCRIGADLPCKP